MNDEIISDFAASLKALRDYVELIRPFIQEHIDKLRQSTIPDLAPVFIALLKEDKEFSEKLISESEDAERMKILLEKFPAQITKHDSGEITFIFEGSYVDKAKIDKGMALFRHTIHQERLLYRSSLLNLTSSLEWFLSQLLHLYFEKFPDAVGTRDNVFSLDDLKAFSTIEDARRHLISSRVEDVLRNNFEYWIKYLKERVGLSMNYLEPNMAQMIEVYQRRNIIVHNGGIVNSIYLSKVGPKLANGLKAGDSIDITPEYFKATIDTFESSFILIASELWKKLQPDDEGRSGLLLELAFNHLLDERWKVAESLSLFLVKDMHMAESRRLSGQINYWQSLKWQGRFEEVRSEVEKSDFSAKEPIFKLALYALLDDKERFFRLLPSVLKNEGLSYHALDTWPIFRGMRLSEEYAQFRQSNIERFEEKSDESSNVETSNKIEKAKGKDKPSLSKKRTVKKAPAKRAANKKGKK